MYHLFSMHKLYFLLFFNNYVSYEILYKITQ